jgi:hypothetical protein
MRFVIYDVETLATCFLIVLHDVDSGKRVCYKISKYQHDWSKMKNHFNHMIKKGYYFVGFNSHKFDAQVMTFVLEEERTAEQIYAYAQYIITMPQADKYEKLLPEWKLLYNDVDIMMVHHFDNKNKMTYLKWLEYAMRMADIQEMPIHHSVNTTEEQEQLIEEYCNYDIDATLKFFLDSKDEMDLRIALRDKFGINCLSYNNGKIGMTILLKKYCEKIGKQPYEISREKGTFRKAIPMKNLIYPFIEFKTPEFNWVLDNFKREVWSFEKEAKEKKKKDKGLFTLSYKQSKKAYGYVYGYGGLHQCIQPGVYEEDDYFCIKDADVSSLYPSIPIAYLLYLQDKYPDSWRDELEKRNSPVIYPEHLGIEVLQVYKEDIVDYRLAEKQKPKKEQDKIIISGYKEAANIPYGKSGDVTSWFYSKSYNLTTTINGQLLISMLSEALYDIPECMMLQNNTDGITVKIPRKHLGLYNQICEEFQKKTFLQLEFVDYKKMVIMNVNNYLAVKINGEIKRKGDLFEVYSDFSGTKKYNKNPSFLVIPEALQAYFVDGKDYKQFINEHTNLYDFLGGVKRSSEGKKGIGYVTYLYEKDGKIEAEEQERVTRYYISKSGGKLVKRFPKDGSETSVVAGWFTKILNTIHEEEIPKIFDDIERLYYIKEAEEIIKKIEGNKQQLKIW